MPTAAEARTGAAGPPDRRALVVGVGLLGRAVLDRLGADGAALTGVDWESPAAARRRLRAAGARVSSVPGWRVAWCAGAGVVGTTAETMRAEQQHFTALLDGLASGSHRGRLFVASSAGGVYGEGTHRVLTEADPPNPRSPYGRGKLAIEQGAGAWATESGATVLVGRISNLYGPGQDLSKGQGFLSQACRRALRNEPITIRVPLETARDFLHAGDAAARIVDWLGTGTGVPDRGRGARTKLFVSGTSVTLARAAALVRAVGRRRTLLVHVADPEAWQQPRYLRFRSEVMPELDRRHPGRPLEAGIGELFESMRRRRAVGEL